MFTNSQNILNSQKLETAQVINRKYTSQAYSYHRIQSSNKRQYTIGTLNNIDESQDYND